MFNLSQKSQHEDHLPLPSFFVVVCSPTSLNSTRLLYTRLKVIYELFSKREAFVQDVFLLSMYLNNLTESKHIPSTLVKYITKKMYLDEDEGEYAVIL